MKKEAEEIDENDLFKIHSNSSQIIESRLQKRYVWKAYIFEC